MTGTRPTHFHFFSNLYWRGKVASSPGSCLLKPPKKVRFRGIGCYLHMCPKAPCSSRGRFREHPVPLRPARGMTCACGVKEYCFRRAVTVNGGYPAPAVFVSGSVVVFVSATVTVVPGRSSNVTCTRVRSTVTSTVNGIGAGLSSSSGMSSASVTDGGVFFDFAFSLKSVKSDRGASTVRGAHGPSENRPPILGHYPVARASARAGGGRPYEPRRRSEVRAHLSRSPTTWRAQ